MFPARELREGHAPPLHAFRQRPATWEGRMPARRKTHCRGGFYIRPGRSRRGGVARDDASIVPYRGLRHRRVRIFPVGRGPAVGRRGGIYPSRGCSRCRGEPGTMRASSPTGGCGIAGFAFSRLAAGPPWFVGEGCIPPAGVFGAAGLPGRDESRPYEQTSCCKPTGWPLTSPPIQFLIPNFPLSPSPR